MRVRLSMIVSLPSQKLAFGVTIFLKGTTKPDVSTVHGLEAGVDERKSIALG